MLKTVAKPTELIQILCFDIICKRILSKYTFLKQMFCLTKQHLGCNFCWVMLTLLTHRKEIALTRQTPNQFRALLHPLADANLEKPQKTTTVAVLTSHNIQRLKVTFYWREEQVFPTHLKFQSRNKKGNLVTIIHCCCYCCPDLCTEDHRRHSWPQDSSRQSGRRTNRFPSCDREKACTVCA